MVALHAEVIARPGLFDHNDSPGPTNEAMTAVAVPLLDALDYAMPIQVSAIRRWTPDSRARAARKAWHAVATEMSGAADLMFGGRHQEDEFNALVLVLAVFAYQPGGVTFATRHWCTDHAQCHYATFQADRQEAAA